MSSLEKKYQQDYNISKALREGRGVASIVHLKTGILNTMAISSMNKSASRFGSMKKEK